RVVSRNLELRPDLLVEELRQSLGGFNGEPVQVKVITVSVLGKPAPFRLAGPRAHGHHAERDDVFLSRIDRLEKVGNAQALVFFLPRELEAMKQLARPGLVNEEVVPLALTLVVAVNRLWLQELLLPALAHELTEDRPDLALHEPPVLLLRHLPLL